jgi:putative glycosyltransferase (TIGR04372 family)
VSRGQLVARLEARLRRAAQEGAWRTALYLLDLVASAALWLMLLPLTLALHLAGFRRLSVLVGRIGHLAAEPDCFLKERALGRIPPARYFMLAPRGAVANETMLAYWEPFIPLVRAPVLCWILRAMSRWMLLKHDVSEYMLRLDVSQKIFPVNADWRGRAPLLNVSPDDRAWSRARFAELGLPAGAWFACVHAREAGFLPAEDAAHAHRNGDPRALVPAMQEIVRRGGWCVRMGDPSMTPLEPMPGLIDYAHHPARSARLDVMLCAHARFFVGNTSGLTLVSTAFGVPSALANMIPPSGLAMLPSDISIPKLLRSRAGRLLPFADVLGGPAANYRFAGAYARAGLEPVENSPEEILELVREMLSRLEGTWNSSPEEDALQARFRRLLRPGHYGYGSAARVGTDFLRRHRDLLPDS